MRQLTRSEKIDLGTKEIARRIRQQLKAEFKGYKFSVTIEFYSMGSSITVRLMKSDIRVKRNFDEITDYALLFYKNNRYTEEQLKSLQNETYHQLNQYILKSDHDPDHWCNGVFLTEQGHNLLKRVVQIVDYYNFDDSDPMTDYYHVNFSFHLSLGKWDKSFIDGKALKTESKNTDWSKVVIEL